MQMLVWMKSNGRASDSSSDSDDTSYVCVGDSAFCC